MGAPAVGVDLGGGGREAGEANDRSLCASAAERMERGRRMRGGRWTRVVTRCHCAPALLAAAAAAETAVAGKNSK